MSEPIILVCGANHSGTSMVAKILLDNGAWGGDIGSFYSPETPYHKYSNKKFSDLCKRAIGINPGGAKTEEFKEFLESLPDEVVVLKYPKSVMISNHIFEIAGRPVKMVYVLRNPSHAVASSVDKHGTSADDELALYCQLFEVGARFNGEVHYTSYERILNGYTDELGKFCGFDIDNVSAVDKGMNHYG